VIPDHGVAPDGAAQEVIVIASPGHDAPVDPSRTARISTSQLFRGERLVVIVHMGQEYRLQITKAGKLILTK
jgi:hemin uptake protein HemP